jgi:hypothetical protein
MFVSYSSHNDAGSKAIAMLLATALLLWMVGAQFIGKQVKAANVIQFSDLVSDSVSDQPANHTLDFILPNGMISGETIDITFEAGFDLTALAGANDVDVAFDGAATTTAGTAAAGVFGLTLATPDAQSLRLTSPTDGVASSTRLTILIGDHTATGDQQIVNPTATTSFTVDLAGTMQDSGQTRVAITDSVLVTASVPTRFDFVVNGTPAGFTIPGVATTTTDNSSSNALPFGVLTSDVSKTLAHQLNVDTNAANGFVVTVEQSQDLQSSTGAIIDSFTDGTYLDTPTAWTAPGDNIALDNTWGHWGLTSDDDSFNAGSNDFWVAASTTPRIIFTHASATDGVTNDIGSTTIGYQIQITPLQEAGNDYSTTLTYIATPTF